MSTSSMNTDLQTGGITFAVDDVHPANRRRTEIRLHEALRASLDTHIESCSDYHQTVIERVNAHPLLEAAHIAFSEHRPLVLSPEAVWITIAQGVANHMAVCGEELRERLVAHQGKLELEFKVDDWVVGSPENLWPDAFTAWAHQIRDHVGPDLHDLLLCDFSATTSVEQTVSRIVMMDVFERYFQYSVVCVCGIPQVTLTATADDWRHLRAKVQRLCIFDIDWWLSHLVPICDQFVRASSGDIDLAHWQSIYKPREAYGGEIINGWVAKLFPYLRSYVGGPCTKRNPIFETGQGFQSLFAPSGLSRVPVLWRQEHKPEVRYLEAVGGLMGVTQDPQTLALRPIAGWAVCERSRIEALLAELTRYHRTSPSLPAPDLMVARRAGMEDDGISVLLKLPPDLGQFYHATGDAELFVTEQPAPFRILPQAELMPLDAESAWYQLVTLRDGGALAINLHHSRRDPRPREDNWRYDPTYAPICLVANEGCDLEDRPVVAVSFTDLLERLLASSGDPFWQQPDFAVIGNAAMFDLHR